MEQLLFKKKKNIVEGKFKVFLDEKDLVQWDQNCNFLVAKGNKEYCSVSSDSTEPELFTKQSAERNKSGRNIPENMQQWLKWMVVRESIKSWELITNALHTLQIFIWKLCWKLCVVLLSLHTHYFIIIHVFTLVFLLDVTYFYYVYCKLLFFYVSVQLLYFFNPSHQLGRKLQMRISLNLGNLHDVFMLIKMCSTLYKNKINLKFITRKYLWK